MSNNKFTLILSGIVACGMLMFTYILINAQNTTSTKTVINGQIINQEKIINKKELNDKMIDAMVQTAEKMGLRNYDVVISIEEK